MRCEPTSSAFHAAGGSWDVGRATGRILCLVSNCKCQGICNKRPLVLRGEWGSRQYTGARYTGVIRIMRATLCQHWALVIPVVYTPALMRQTDEENFNTVQRELRQTNWRNRSHWPVTNGGGTGNWVMLINGTDSRVPLGLQHTLLACEGESGRLVNF